MLVLGVAFCCCVLVYALLFSIGNLGLALPVPYSVIVVIWVFIVERVWFCSLVLRIGVHFVGFVSA